MGRRAFQKSKASEGIKMFARPWLAESKLGRCVATIAVESVLYLKYFVGAKLGGFLVARQQRARF